MRNLRSPILALVLLAGVLLVIGVPLLTRGSLVPQPVVTDSPPVEYRNAELGFRLTYPGNWQTLVDPQELPRGDNLHAVVFLPSTASKSLVIVYVQTLTQTQTLDQYVADQMTALRANEAGVQFSQPTTLTLGGNVAARETTAMIMTEDPPRWQRVIMIVDGQRAYALYYAGPPEGRYPDTFNAIVQSFSFVR